MDRTALKSEGGSTRHRLLIALGVFCLAVFALGWLLAGKMGRTYDRAFPVPPRQFLEQAERISKGTAREEARTRVRNFTERIESGDGRTVKYILRAVDSGKPFGASAVFIEIRYDAVGRVESVRTGDD